MLTIKRPTFSRSPRAARAARPVVGLEIEPGAIHAVEVKLDGGLRIERSATAQLDPGVVRDGEIMDVDALAAALKTLFEEHGLGNQVRVGIANQRTVVRHLLLPPIPDPGELATAVRFQAESELPMPLDQAVLEHASLGIVDTPLGPRERILVVAARRDMIDRLLAAISKAGLRPVGIDLSAFGMIRALPAREDALVVHLSVGGLVNLALTRGGDCLFTRVVAHGLEPMAAELAERRGITVAEARQALIEAGVSAPGSVPAADVSFAEGPVDGPDTDEQTMLCQTILADGIRRIAADVRNSIDFHLTGSPADSSSPDGAAPRVEHVLLTGSAVAVPGFAAALEAELGLPVEIAEVAGADPREPGSHAVAAGLAIEAAAA